MRRRDFGAVLGGAAFAWPFVARAQPKLRTVGVLVSASPPHPFAEHFRRGLRAFGYTEGQNVAVEFHYTEGRSDHAEDLAAELVRRQVNVIVAHFTPTIKAAIAATRTIPIVMAPAGAPLQSGFIESLARPGRNVTGLSAMEAEIGARRLQLLRELIPDLACVAVLASTPTTDPFSEPFVEDLRSAAAKAGLRLEPVLVGGASEFRSAVAAMAKAGAQAVIVQPLFEPHRKTLIDLATRHRLAYMSGSRAATEAGGLVSFSANFLVLYERAAFYVDKLLKGAKPAELPVEQPSIFHVAINMKTAQTLGLTVSPALFAQIDDVFE